MRITRRDGRLRPFSTPALAIIVVALAACRPQHLVADARQAAGCDRVAAHTLTDAGGHAAFVESTAIIQQAGGVFIMGYPTIVLPPAGTPVPANQADWPMFAGAQVNPAGEATFLPSPSMQRLANPKAIVDPSGDLSLFWVDGDSLYDAISGRPIRVAQWANGRWGDVVDLAGTDNMNDWRRNTVSGSNRCSGPSRRHWYSPPTSSMRRSLLMPCVG